MEPVWRIENSGAGVEVWRCGGSRTVGKPEGADDVWLTFFVGLFGVKVHPLQGQRKGCQ